MVLPIRKLSYRSISTISARQLKTDTTTSKHRLAIESIPSKQGLRQRHAMLLNQTGKKLSTLSGDMLFNNPQQLEGNIENYIGMSMVPTGVIGPFKINGTDAQGDFYIPLATSEGALVASYHRGAKACSLAGGVTVRCVKEGVQRSPGFKFNNLQELGQFVAWVVQREEVFRQITKKHSRFAQLKNMKTNIEGNHLILSFEFETGDAAGQNMVTICTSQICKYIVRNAPVKPQSWYLESNYSGDKKATALSFTNVRGKKVTAEVVLPANIVQEVLKSSPKAIVDYWQTSTMAVVQSGAIGMQGHFANGLTALFMATGQDVACVAEAATGVNRMELTNDGSLYVSVTLPNLVVGTVGGGTSLPTQRECLELMDCYGAGKARKFAEICAAVVIAGEISIAAAMSAHHFAAAHQNLGRKK